jgi:DNA repair photolyase
MLFGQATALPTTREVARVVKAGGAQALTEAQRLADQARYQEIRCRSALNRVEGMPFRWTLNPYRGCTHACHYCFARRYQTQLELGAGDEFSSLIFVKVNFAEVLARELDRPRWTRELVAFGTATDPYQPIEGRYRLSRRTLEALVRGRTPAGLVTKGPLVVRDVDLLQELTRIAPGTSVCLSVPTVDEEAWRALEPGTAHPLQRLRALRTLVDAGIDAGVLMAPLVPACRRIPRSWRRRSRPQPIMARASRARTCCSSTAGRAITSCGFSPTASRLSSRSTSSSMPRAMRRGITVRGSSGLWGCCARATA